MGFKQSASILTFLAAGILTFDAADAQQVPNTTPSNVNVLNLLAPYLNLNATPIGQQTLQLNLSQAIAQNQNASLAQQAEAISDKALPGSNVPFPLPTITLANGTKVMLGPGDNLAGGLPLQQIQNSQNGTKGTIAPYQPVGGYGQILGPIYQTGIRSSTDTTGPLKNTFHLLNSAYIFTSSDLGVAKNYFANGAATNPSVTPPGYQPVPAVAPPGYSLPRANGLPNTTDSVYDIAYGVKNTDPGQDVYGSSRPVQVRPNSYNKFDPAALDGLATNPSFPSGHTTYAFTDSILLAMLVPQAYQSMMLRASDYANSRIVLGVHYPLDIIASRALVTYDLAQAFTNPLYINNPTTTGGPVTGVGTPINLPQLFAAAAPEIQAYFATQCGASVATCANSAANTNGSPYVPSAANQALYQQRLTYGLPTLTYAQAPREAAPAGGPDASILLAPLYGGSTAAAKAIEPNGGIYANLATTTINQILVNTEGKALAAFYGSPLSYWTRIDLYSAAGYFNGVIGTLSLQPTDVVNTNVTIAATGVLSADGRINGTTTVLANGKLAGSGTVSSVTVNAAGTLAPGSLAAQAALRGGQANVTGTRLAVNGNIAFAPGGRLAIFVTQTQATSVAATGGANVAGGRVSVTTSAKPSTPGTRYTILTAAGGVSGRFNPFVSSNFAFFRPTLAYDANDVFLDAKYNYVLAGGSQNERNVGAGLNNVAYGSQSAAGQRVIGALNRVKSGQAGPVLDSLTGEGITAAQNSALRSSQLFNSAIFDQTTFYGGGGAANSVTLTESLPGFVALAHPEQTLAAANQGAPIKELADLPSGRIAPTMPALVARTWRAWGTGFGGVETIDGNRALGSARQDNSIIGGAIGVDYQLLPNYLIGVAVGGSDGEFRVPGRGTSGSTTGGHVAFYDIATFGKFYGASSTSFSYYGNKTSRFVTGFGGLASETERGNFDSHEFRTRLEFGRHFDSEMSGFGLGGLGAITPFLALEIAELRSNGFTERAFSGPGLLGLNVQGQSIASVPAFVGARFQRLMPLGNGMVLSPTLQVAYVHEFAPYRSQIGQIASLPGSVFLVDGARPARDAVQVKAGGEIAIGPRAALFANFDGEFSGINQLYAGKGGFRYLW